MYHGERLNAWTHLVGAVAAFIGGVWMLVIACLDGSPWKIVSVAIYAFTLLVLYSASTVYHSVRGRKKAIMKKVDHFSIYLLIAGSYTPFCLVTLRGPWGWTLFGIVWGLALIGILQEIKPRSEARILSIVIYAVMGWIVLVAVKPLIAALGTTGFAWLASGGVLYTVGIIFFALDHRLRHAHGIWHLFVIAGELAALCGDSVLCPVARLTDRSHALRGNASCDALRHVVWDAERPGLHSHAERGNDHCGLEITPKLLGHRQCHHWRGLGTQYARAEAGGVEAVAFGLLDFGIRQTAFRPDQERQRRRFGMTHQRLRHRVQH